MNVSLLLHILIVPFHNREALFFLVKIDNDISVMHMLC